MAVSFQDGYADDFDVHDRSIWYVADFTIYENWINTAWEADNVSFNGDGTVTLTLDGAGRDGKDYTGAEISAYPKTGYGTYEVRMQASGEHGINSNFFTYTGSYFGDEWSEIDFEFLGKDPTKVWVNYHSGDGHYEGRWIDLGFDASQGMHDYAFVWEPNSIQWFVDGRKVHEVANPAIDVPFEDAKIYMNIWAGQENWLGTPDLAGSTSVTYDAVSFTPWDGVYSHSPAPEPAPVAAFLMDADTDKVIMELEDGTIVPIAAIEGRNITIAAEVVLDTLVGPAIDSIVLDLDGQVEATENVSPFALLGDDAGDLHGGLDLASGEHVLGLDLFDGKHATGAPLGTYEIAFTVGESAPAPAPEPVEEPDPVPQPDPAPAPEEEPGHGSGGGPKKDMDCALKHGMRDTKGKAWGWGVCSAEVVSREETDAVDAIDADSFPRELIPALDFELETGFPRDLLADFGL